MRTALKLIVFGAVLVLVQWASVPFFHAGTNLSLAAALLVELPFWLFGAPGFGLLWLFDILFAGGRISFPDVLSPTLALLQQDPLRPVFATNVAQLVLSASVYWSVMAVARRSHDNSTSMPSTLLTSFFCAVVVVWLYLISSIFLVGHTVMRGVMWLPGFILSLFEMSMPGSLMATHLKYEFFFWETCALLATTTTLLFPVVVLIGRVVKPARSATCYSPVGQPSNSQPRSNKASRVSLERSGGAP